MSESDLSVAQRIAAEVATAEREGRRKSWRRVTTLVYLFGGARLTEALRARMVSAFEEVGLTSEPSLADPAVTRASTVRLTTRRSADAAVPHLDRSPGVDPAVPPADPTTVTVSYWVPGHAPRTGGVAAGQEVTLIQVDPNAEPADRLLELCRPFCGESLTLDMVDDLLGADAEPKLDVSDPHVRRLSTVGVVTEEVESETGESSAGSVIFEPVEFLIGTDWLIVCWHNGQAAGSFAAIDRPGSLRGDVIATVERTWRQQQGSSPGELAALICFELARTYARAVRDLQSWLEQWEIKAGRAADEDVLEVETLVSLRLHVSEFFRRLHFFNQAKYSSADHRWFPEPTPLTLQEEVDDLVDRGLASLAGLGAAVRGCMELANMHRIGLQMRRAEEEQKSAEVARKQSDNFQRIVGYVAAVVLAPSLIAAIYGANTNLPGAATWWGFAVMLGGMALTGLVAWRAMERYLRRGSTHQQP